MPIRRLGEGDEAVAEVACRVFGAEGELDTAAFLAAPSAHVLLAEDDDGIAGWVYGHELVHPDGERTMLLYALDVARRAQRRGHGRALTEAFVELARERGCTEVWVLTESNNPGGNATYAAAGGVREQRDAAMYVWTLAPGRHTGDGEWA